MADVTEKTGKSVEEAINLALVELNCSRDDVEIEILSEPAKGLWGLIGTRDAKVRVQKKMDSYVAIESAGAADGTEANVDEDRDNVADVAESDEAENLPSDTDDKTARFIMDVAGLMGIEAGVARKTTDDALLYTLNGPRLGSAIGRRGETLDAIQYLANIVAGKGKEIPRKRVIVDAEDYRKRREETLVRLATRLAAKAKKSGRRVVLEPMNPQERRVIHTTLEKDPDVKSLSEGEEPFRRLVIYPVDGDARTSGNQRYNRSGSSGSSGSSRYGKGGNGGGSVRSGNERTGTPRYSWGMDDDSVTDDDE